jgi:RNA polymerase sigma-70 factor, ECF subfamily
VTLTDEGAMRAFQQGDSTGIKLLVQRYERALYNFALRQVRSPHAAEDIVQEAFVRIVQNAQDFKYEAKFSTWAYTIARNLCIDLGRKNALRKHPSLDQANDNDDGPTLGERTAGKSDVERELVSGELRVRIAAAVEQLPDDQREVFVLREVSNLPFKEIAEITGVSENTVKSRMRYALERLQHALAAYEEHAREHG